jgi:hypothetical protein
LALVPDSPGLPDAPPVHGRNLLRVVSLVFGLPLVALTAAVWSLQVAQVTAQPLLSLMLLAGLGCMVFVLVKANGDKLLHTLQPQQNEAGDNYE